jgi:hypothetical protein
MKLALVYRALFDKDHQPRHRDDTLEAADGAVDEFRKAKRISISTSPSASAEKSWR